MRVAIVGLLALFATTAAADILFPQDAQLRATVGLGIDANYVKPGGDTRAVKTVSILRDPVPDPQSNQSDAIWDAEYFRTETEYTRKTTSGAKTTSLFGLSIAASYNKQETKERKDDHINATFYLEAITRFDRLENNLTALEIDDLQPDIQSWIVEAKNAVQDGNSVKLRALQGDFAKKYGTGMLAEIQNGAIYYVDYEWRLKDSTKYKDVKRSVELVFDVIAGGADDSETVDQKIKANMESVSGRYIGHESTELGCALNFKRAVEVASGKKGCRGEDKGEGDGGHNWLKKVQENPMVIRYRYLGYENIPVLRLLADPRTLINKTLATDLKYFPEDVPASAAFIAYRNGWQSWGFGTIPKLIPTAIDTVEEGTIAITFAVELEILKKCDPDANKDTAPDEEFAKLCKDSISPSSRLALWRHWRDTNETEYRVPALKINDPWVPRRSMLRPLLLSRIGNLDDPKRYPLLLDPGNAIEEGTTIRALINSLQAGNGGYTVRYKVNEEQKTSVLKALADGDVFVQTIASIESDDFSGPPVALRPYPVGKVVVPEGEQVTLKYHIVPDDEVDELVAHFNAQNAEFQESTKVRVYESGCSEGALEMGAETCRKRFIAKSGIDSRCRIRNGAWSLSLGYKTQPWEEQNCLRLGRCRYGPYVAFTDDRGNVDWDEMYKLHKPVLDLVGGWSEYVGEITCKNKATDKYSVETPLPALVEPTLENLIPKGSDDELGEN